MKESLLNCKNCNSVVKDNYCGHCGQAAATDRINVHYLLHEVQHSLLHVDKGILYTIKKLLLNPGKTIKDYLDGKRVIHFKPFALVILLGGIYGFFTFFFEVYPESEVIDTSPDSSIKINNYSKLMLDWIYSHYSLVMLSIIPFSALSSFLIFRKSGYNYIEHLVIYSYITGIQILILLVSYPIYYSIPSLSVYCIIFAINYSYNIWVLAQLFKKTSWINVILKAVLSIIFAMITIMVVTFIISLIIVILDRSVIN